MSNPRQALEEARRTPAVIVGPFGHCLAPGHEGRVVVNQWGGHSLAQACLKARENSDG